MTASTPSQMRCTEIRSRSAGGWFGGGWAGAQGGGGPGWA